MRFALVLTAAGTSSRFGEKKEYLPICPTSEKTVLCNSLTTFLEADIFSVVVITVLEKDELLVKKAIESALLRAQKKGISIYFTAGGRTRQESVFKALLVLEKLKSTQRSNFPENILFEAVMIHDGARPWVSKEVIFSVAQATQQYSATCPAVATVDTCKQVDSQGKIIQHLERKTIFAVQTPQSFLFEKILAAHKKAQYDNKEYTDDTEIWEEYEGSVYICQGDYKNRKITFKSDLAGGENE